MSDEQIQATEAITTHAIVANRDPLIDIKEMKFGFRTLEDAETGVKSKRANVEIPVQVLSIEGIIKVLEQGGKPLELLVNAVENIYDRFIKDMLADDATLTSENFPLDQITWDAIANQPESERKGRGIAKEIWEDFYKDYLAVMPGLTGKEQKHIERQVAVLSQKLNPLKNHENKAKLLPQFKDMLTVYLNGSKNAEAYTECVDFLMKKADALVNAEANLGANLGFED